MSPDLKPFALFWQNGCEFCAEAKLMLANELPGQYDEYLTHAATTPGKLAVRIRGELVEFDRREIPRFPALWLRERNEMYMGLESIALAISKVTGRKVEGYEDVNHNRAPDAAVG